MKIVNTLTLLVLLVIGNICARGQAAGTYIFTPSSGTFTEITGGSAVSGIETDDGVSAVIDLGFTFNFCGVDYTQVKASSNGWLSFNTSITGSNLTNSETYLTTIGPAVFPLWDDLSGAVGEGTYETSGTAPNRIFTIQYKDWRWNYSSAYDPTLSFQIKLYETTNKVEFIYRQEAGTGNPSGASIGITDATPTYLSLNNTTATPVASSTTLTTDLDIRPATGQVYEFMPPAPCTGTPDGGTAIASVTSACEGVPFDLMLTGASQASQLSYQWFSSPAGAGTFTPIAGATQNYYAATQAAATDYYCEVTCIPSGQSDNSATVTVLQNSFLDCYCTSGATYTGDEEIFNVTFSSINQSSDCATTGTGPSSILNQYSDYTTGTGAPAPADIQQGATLPFSVSVNTCGGNYTNRTAIFIDYDQNGLFTDASDLAYLEPSGVQGPHVVSGNITVPTTAILGITRMRVVTKETSGDIDPCTVSSWGETEDYFVNIIPMPPCANVTFPSAVTTLANPGAVCVTGDVTLTLDQEMPVASGITYQWASSTSQAGPFTNLGVAITTPGYIANVTTNTWFRCDIKCDGVTVVTSAPVEVQAVVPETPEVMDGQNCGPGEVTMSGTVSNGDIYWFANATGGAPLAVGSSFTTPPLLNTTTYYASAGASPPVDSFVGIGNSQTSSVTSPFYNGWGGYKHQYLITAQELTDIGAQAGEITSIGVDVNSTDQVTFNDFSINMANTSVTALSGWVTADLVEVFSPAAVTPADGQFMFTFNTPFVWDGVSNVVIQTCHSNEDYGGTSIPVRYDNTSFVSHRYYYMDNTPVATICGGTSGYTTSSRPKFFIQAPGCQSQRVEVNAYIRDTPVVDLGPDESLCGDADQSITLDAQNPGSTYLWSDGSSSQTLTVTQSGTYYVTVTNEFGCISSDTTSKEILLAPEVDLGNDTTVCEGVTLTLDAGDDGITYYWNTGSLDQTIDVDQSGTYVVIVTNDLNCTVVDTVNITVSGELPSIDAIIIDNVGPYTFNFQAFNPQGAVGQYNWDFGDGTPVSNAVSPTHTYATEGNYQVTLTLNTEQCGLLQYATSVHILGVGDIKVDDAMLSLYPNPAKDIVTIESKGDFKMKSIVVTNILGQVVLNEKTGSAKKHDLNVSGFASGIYSVKVETDKGNVIRKFEVLK